MIVHQLHDMRAQPRLRVCVRYYVAPLGSNNWPLAKERPQAFHHVPRLTH
jgi:hypothetical protein